MTTGIEQICGALRLIGQLAEGEVPSAASLADCFKAMNQMIDSWNIERLSVFHTRTTLVNWLAGQPTRTIGPNPVPVPEIPIRTVAPRPIMIDPSTYYRDPTNGVSYPIALVNQDQYNSIALKTVTSTYPSVMYVDMTYPALTMTVYPVPTRDLEFYIVSVEPLSELASPYDDFILPPGYMRPFKFNLACEIAPEYGVEPSRTVQRIAMKSKQNLKRINQTNDLMSMPYMLISTNSRYNIYSDNY